MKTAIIVHGWDGKPEVGWFKWLEEELKKKGFKVIKPHMPHPESPKITSWVKKLSDVAKNTDEKTIFIGHSIGCQTIIRYLETSKAKKVSKVIFIAPWFTLTDVALEEKESKKIAKPWLETKINFKKVKSKITTSTAIFSINDPLVSIENAKKFKKEFESKIIFQKNKGHYEENRIKKIPIILKEILEK